MSETAELEVSKKPPVVLLVVGMAGSGKTTLMHRLQTDLQERAYVINLDPAVHEVPYQPNVDIRDSVNFKEVMESYDLGPNGGILTSLNLFATRFDQVMDICKNRDQDFICVDTPGQIEVFTWSASGMIISDAFASAFPTVLVYVIDTPRSSNPITFMSNMTYACSILYKTKLPFLLVFNKTDVVSHVFAEEWMADLNTFQEALDKEETYMATFSRSLALALDEFYNNIKSCGVSAVTGFGMDNLFDQLDLCVEDYHTLYVPFVDKCIADRKAEEEAAAAKEE